MVLRPLPVVKVQYLAQLPAQFLEKTDPGKKISIHNIILAFSTFSAILRENEICRIGILAENLSIFKINSCLQIKMAFKAWST